MIIYMMETRRGSPDGFDVNRYYETKYYNVPHTMGTDFVNKGWALEVPDEDNILKIVVDYCELLL